MTTFSNVNFSDIILVLVNSRYLFLVVVCSVSQPHIYHLGRSHRYLHELMSENEQVNECKRVNTCTVHVPEAHGRKLRVSE